VLLEIVVVDDDCQVDILDELELDTVSDDVLDIAIEDELGELETAAVVEDALSGTLASDTEAKLEAADETDVDNTVELDD
jgi:hypothetical protein